MRQEDAEPDEIAVVPEEQKAGDEEKDAAPPTPGGHPIPRTVVEETSGNSEAQSHPEKKYTADAPPDLILKHDGSEEVQEGTDVQEEQEEPISPTLSSPQSGHSRRDSSPEMANTDGADEGFGDDFDDFEEGDEGADFDDFDDGFQEPEEEEMPATPASPPSSAPAIQQLSFPIPDFDSMGMEDILATTEPYLNALFPTTAEADEITITPPPSKDNPIFLTPRSASLWSQLVAPPPLQPPDWIRSRIRRLFLVSLGVPVDLDEILPASKQKKLVLPSVHSPRTSSDSRRSQSKTPTRLRTPQLGQEGGGGGNGNNNSSESGGAPRTGTKRKAPPPEFDLVAAKQLCSTTDEALDGMTDGELKAHLEKLQAMEGTAIGVLNYWQQRTDEQIGEREAFEGVIENLVKHARKTRK